MGVKLLFQVLQTRIIKGFSANHETVTDDAGILQNKRRIQRLHLILSSRGFLRDVF